MEKFEIIRVHPPPYGSVVYVYYAGTENQIPLYKDKNKTTPLSQPIVLTDQNLSFYCENTRADIKIIHYSYDGGYLLLKDQIIFDHDSEEHHIDGGTF